MSGGHRLSGRDTSPCKAEVLCPNLQQGQATSPTRGQHSGRITTGRRGIRSSATERRQRRFSAARPIKPVTSSSLTIAQAQEMTDPFRDPALDAMKGNCRRAAALKDHASRANDRPFRAWTHGVHFIQSIRSQANGTTRDSRYKLVTASRRPSSVE
jgi:hypothetical protein